MLQAFVDESGNGAPDYFVMAGYVSTTEMWLTFINDWQRLLDLNDHPHRPMTRLKMSQMTHDRGLRRAEMFYRVIEENVLSAFSVTIDVAGMRKALNEFKWPDWVVEREKLSNPYYFAFQAIADGLAQVQGYFKLLEPVDFVFDEATTKVPCIEGWDLIKTNSSPDVARYLGDTPIFRREEDLLPLQAADLYAYWVRKWAIEGNEHGVDRLDFPWKAENDIPRFERIFREDDFKQQLDRSILVHTLRRSGVGNAARILSKKAEFTIRWAKDA